VSRKALKNWQEKLAYYEHSLSIVTDIDRKFELRKKIEECHENIERLEQKISHNQQENPTLKDRRNFIKLLVLGGTGTILIFVLPQIFNLELKSKKKSPNFANIQLASVKLNSKGDIVKQPITLVQVFKEDLGNTISLTMVKVSAGEFLMGSPAIEVGRFENESPQHKVNVPEFYLGQTLVTQSQWRQVMGNNPSHFTGNGKLPVEQVSWLDANEFCQKLSQRVQREYRLPNEAEWEYACRAGTITPFYFGETISSQIANYRAQGWQGEIYAGKYGDGKLGEYRNKTTPVDNFPPNIFGVYDLHGNVLEWCLDHWHDNYEGAPSDGSAWLSDNDTQRLLRGGSCYYRPRDCRSASRWGSVPDNRSEIIGFRVVCETPRTS
jgi:formylglycine-generating enzyme required for sulfatase activity